MELIEQLIARAKADKQRIVLPEGTEERTLKAANQILTDGVADLIILGNVDEILEKAQEWGLGNISKATLGEDCQLIFLHLTETSQGFLYPFQRLGIKMQEALTQVHNLGDDIRLHLTMTHLHEQPQ